MGVLSVSIDMHSQMKCMTVEMYHATDKQEEGEDMGNVPPKMEMQNSPKNDVRAQYHKRSNLSH